MHDLSVEFKHFFESTETLITNNNEDMPLQLLGTYILYEIKLYRLIMIIVSTLR